MKRLFVAVRVRPDEEFVSKYRQLRQELAGNRITWVDTGVMHITLKFLGETQEDQIQVINRALFAVTSNQPVIDLRFDTLGLFGSRYDPRVIWLGNAVPGSLAQLGESVLDGLHDAGFIRDRQNFVPHLTLGRIRNLHDKRYFQQVMDKYRHSFQLPIHVDELLLYHSQLLPSGPVYHEVSAFRLLST